MPTPILLSILIPVYNWDVRLLLKQLQLQVKSLQGKVGIEIIVVDDASSENYDILSVAEKQPTVHYERARLNRGRAYTRNQLLHRARGQYVLFLDADMLPDNNTFLLHYIRQAQMGFDIICGGISYQQICEPEQLLSFYVYKSNNTEALPAISRNQMPWRYLFTSNIMIRRRIAQRVRFDPRFTGYGFEDIEWALRLSGKYRIKHIDNTCSHMGLMEKSQVFSKMHDSLENYGLLLSLHSEAAAKSSGARISNYLRLFPDGLLRWTDLLLRKLFHSISWNPLAYLFFQCDKMVALSRIRKRENRSSCKGIPQMMSDSGAK